MSIKIIWTGIGLSALGLGYFLPITAPIGAIVLIVGVVLLWRDK